MKIKSVKYLVLAILFPIAVGGLAAIFSSESMSIYDTLNRPSIAPPGFIFPIVWTILYILMGIASYFVYESDCEERTTALKTYLIQLGINFLFNIIFFNLGLYLLAFLWTILLLFVNIVMIQLFFRCDKLSGYLLVPYIAWNSFAILLSYMVYALNR